MVLKRTVVIGDSKIIMAFKKLCKSKGMFPGKAILNWMKEYVEQHEKEGVARGKKTKPL